MKFVRETGRWMVNSARRLHVDERGQGMTEYTVLLCLVVVTSIAAVTSIGATLLGKFEFLDQVMEDFGEAVRSNLGS